MVPVIAFWSLAALAVVGALLVVAVRNVFRAALFLVLSFLAIAGLFLTLHADFLAAAQVLIYVGAISVLLVFGIMLTSDVQRGSPNSSLWLPGLAIAVLLFFVLALAFTQGAWPVAEATPLSPTTGPLAEVLFNRWVLAFEVVSVLLLAAVIGAVAVMRRR
ncbi:MAG: NADH-quinone oxidoreductase subunit J [Chloroflexi bacterium]|nr:NADH-quinone oxidoreductase subunit J [Chloroflexota bacterium]